MGSLLYGDVSVMNITRFVSDLVENMFSHDAAQLLLIGKMTMVQTTVTINAKTLIYMYIGIRRVTQSIDFSIQTRLVLEIKELRGLARCLIFKI